MFISIGLFLLFIAWLYVNIFDDYINLKCKGSIQSFFGLTFLFGIGFIIFGVMKLTWTYLA